MESSRRKFEEIPEPNYNTYTNEILKTIKFSGPEAVEENFNSGQKRQDNSSKVKSELKSSQKNEVKKQQGKSKDWMSGRCA